MLLGVLGKEETILTIDVIKGKYAAGTLHAGVAVCAIH